MVNGVPQFEFHMGPGREFALFAGSQEDHRDHLSSENLLIPSTVPMEGSRARHTWVVPSLGVTLTGCPLDEKISEMNLVKQNGNSIGALAITVVDNPMAAGTGADAASPAPRGLSRGEPIRSISRTGASGKVRIG